MANGELRDLRAKITPETWCVIEALHRATGQEHSCVVRDVLHRWALEQVGTATLLQKLLTAEGIAGKAGEPSP